MTDLNQAIFECLTELNHRPFQKLNGTRRSLFESVERPALQPLPATPFELAEWKQVTVGNDYHVEVDRHYYSVPHAYMRRKVEIRHAAQTAEAYWRGERIASHSLIRQFRVLNFSRWVRVQTVKQFRCKSTPKYLAIFSTSSFFFRWSRRALRRSPFSYPRSRCLMVALRL